MGDEGFVNLGKFAWEVVKDNRPKVNLSADYVNAVPKDVPWDQLSAPVGTNTDRWKWRGPGWLSDDFWFLMELSYTYGSRYRGGGAYITNATVNVIDHYVGLGGYHIDITCKIGNVEPAPNSRTNAPVPRIPIDVSLSYTNWLWGGGGTNRFEIWGTGQRSSKWDDMSYEP